MERLTIDYGEDFRPFRYSMKDGSDAEIGYFKNYDAFYSHMLMVQKLGEYEDLEEQGLLLRLPCKVGDTVYHIEDNEINKFVVYSFDIRPLQQFVCNYEGISLNFKNFGKTVFLTKEETEQKLKEMNTDNGIAE